MNVNVNDNDNLPSNPIFLNDVEEKVHNAINSFSHYLKLYLLRHFSIIYNKYDLRVALRGKVLDKFWIIWSIVT